MKIIIAGSRTFNDDSILNNIMNKNISIIDEVVCGGAQGADELGRQWAINNGIKVKMFPAEWNKYGKSAGYIRNKQMGDYADSVIAFWDGTSRGTAHMINYMKTLNKPTYVYNYITHQGYKE